MIRILVATCVALLLASCAGNDPKTTSRADTPSAPGTEGAACCNTVCPMRGDAIEPGHTTQFHGYTIGFCCDECRGKFDVLGDEAKTTKITAAMLSGNRTWPPKN